MTFPIVCHLIQYSDPIEIASINVCLLMRFLFIHAVNILKINSLHMSSLNGISSGKIIIYK
jgi:hypothetical protein